MRIMPIFKNFKALYKGELFARTKRLIERKTGLIKRKFYLPTICIFDFSQIITFKFEFFKFIQFFNMFEVMGTTYEIEGIENYQNDEFKNVPWYDINIKNYKDDVRVFWEKNRLQFLPIYAILAIRQNNPEKLVAFLRRWEEVNPYNYGLNWVSNLEIAIRSVSIFLAYIVYITYTGSRNDYIERLLFKHIYRVYKDIEYTEKCMPNNHLIGEAAALYLVGSLLKTEYSDNFLRRSKRILKDCISFFRDDGTYIESSLSYHRFAIQMYLLVYLLSKRLGDDFLEHEFQRMITQSYKFFCCIEKQDGTYPQFGDWDDGVFYRTSSKSPTNFRDFVDSLGYMAGYHEIKNVEISFLEAFFGNIYGESLVVPDFYSSYPIFELFSYGKYGVYKDYQIYVFINNEEQIFHAHADGLAIELSFGGKHVLTDSGTYSYNLNKNLRRYFRSTRAHNTAFLGADQSTQVGSFRWVDQAFTTLRKSNSGFEGEVIYKNGSRHVRKILIAEQEVCVEDIIKSCFNTFPEINFHFHPDRHVQILNKNKVLIDNDIIMLVESAEEFKLEKLKSLCSYHYMHIGERDNVRIVFYSNTVRCKVLFRKVD